MEAPTKIALRYAAVAVAAGCLAVAGIAWARGWPFDAAGFAAFSCVTAAAVALTAREAYAAGFRRGGSGLHRRPPLPAPPESPPNGGNGHVK
jgi:hypothetical protein